MGAGHAASLAMRAVKKGLIKARAIAAVAPTWAGPMPIVFGREPDMESRLVFLSKEWFSHLFLASVYFKAALFWERNHLNMQNPHDLFNERLAFVMI